MARRAKFEPTATLEDHAAVAHLAQAARDLRQLGERVAAALEGRTVWMINSTESGGGVAEMLPAMITLLRDLGIAAEWLVIEATDAEFFNITKRIHNLIHGAGDPTLTDADRRLYEEVNASNAAGIAGDVADGDIVIVHDPQPMPLAGMLRERRAINAVWRCHIGLDRETERTSAVWRFLQPYADAYDFAVFSAPEYIPSFLANRAHIIQPAIDPLTAKNRHIGLHHTIEILACSGLAVAPGPLLAEPLEHRAQRLQRDGGWRLATSPEDFGLLTRPIVTQVSRWDRLKGFLPLMHGFTALKRRFRAGELEMCDSPHARRLELVRLVMAGPDPESVADDPEGVEVLDSLVRAYGDLDDELQAEIALITLPMRSAHENALMVNALHRVSTIVAQNSLREGFGLTITEAMWKRVPVFTNSQACGPRHQVRDHLDGRLIGDPEDIDQIAAMLAEMLCDPESLEQWARNAQHRAHERFLIFTQLQNWLERLAALA
jgi:trehalose synthase